MSDVKIRKGQVTIPTRIRSRLGIADGDVLDMKVRSNCVVLTPKAPTDDPQFEDDELTPAQRKIIDAELAKGLEDVRMGRVYGPFKTIAELERSMRLVGKKARSKQKR
jgi:AbrB family looped-hinge helix DNA binding protein